MSKLFVVQSESVYPKGEEETVRKNLKDQLSEEYTVVFVPKGIKFVGCFEYPPNEARMGYTPTVLK